MSDVDIQALRNAFETALQRRVYRPEDRQAVIDGTRLDRFADELGRPDTAAIDRWAAEVGSPARGAGELRPGRAGSRGRQEARERFGGGARPFDRQHAGIVDADAGSGAARRLHPEAVARYGNRAGTFGRSTRLD